MKKTHFGVPGTLVWVEEGSHGTDKPFMINTYTLQHKWKIEREYVPFEKAIEAYKEGKGIVCHVEERKFRYKKGENLYSSMYLDEIILGQWVIEQ